MKQSIETYMTEHYGAPTRVLRLDRLSGGACQDNYRLDLNVDGAEQGREFVLRTDKAAALDSSLTRVQEFKVSQLAHQAGVLTPRPIFFESDESILGHPFYLMELIQGKATGRYIVKDRSLIKIRGQVLRELASNLARLHAVREADKPGFEFLDTGFNREDTLDYALATLGRLRAMLADLNTLSPALEMIFNWLEANPPAISDPVLVHGDFRTGNYMVDANGLHGIVDWEFAHWGDGHEDLAWFCMRDWRFGKNKLEAGGIGSRADLYQAYAETAGQSVDERRVTFWEIVGNVKWAIGARRQAWRHLSGQDRGIELASIGRRCAEMEYEALRLIESIH